MQIRNTQHPRLLCTYTESMLHVYELATQERSYHRLVWGINMIAGKLAENLQLADLTEVHIIDYCTVFHALCPGRFSCSWAHFLSSSVPYKIHMYQCGQLFFDFFLPVRGVSC